MPNVKNKAEQDKIISLFGALGDPTRFRLLSLLEKKQRICVSELANEVGISNAGVSQQLKILEQAGLITRNRNGQKICYTINKDTGINKSVFNIIRS